MSLGESRSLSVEEMRSVNADEAPIYYNVYGRKPDLCVGKSIVARIGEKLGNPVIEVDSRLIQILESINNRRENSEIPSEGKIQTVSLNHSNKSYGVELSCEKLPWLSISDASIHDESKLKHVWAVSILSDGYLAPFLERLLIGDMKSRVKISERTGEQEDKTIRYFEYDYGRGDADRVPLQHIFIEPKRRKIQRPAVMHGGTFITAWSGLVFDLDFFKLDFDTNGEVRRMLLDDFPSTSTYRAVLNQISYRNELQQMFFSVLENKLGFMLQAKYSNGGKLEITQVWDSDSKRWYNQISSSVPKNPRSPEVINRSDSMAMLDKFKINYNITFR
jgi:hypothetical protein